MLQTVVNVRLKRGERAAKLAVDHHQKKPRNNQSSFA